MHVIAAAGEKYVFNLQRGEELFETLTNWINEHGVRGATLAGLGACDQLELAYYNLESKTYERHTIEEEVEILSLVGNVAMLENKIALHIHGTFGKRDLSTFGGHLFKLRVSGACEIHLTTFDKTFVRSFDEATGLNLLCPAGQ